jgi:hypothetical protein
MQALLAAAVHYVDLSGTLLAERWQEQPVAALFLSTGRLAP